MCNTLNWRRMNYTLTYWVSYTMSVRENYLVLMGLRSIYGIGETSCHPRVSKSLRWSTNNCSFHSFIDLDVFLQYISHWGRVTHICVSKLAIISSDNGLAPGRRQAIIWTNAGILLTEPLGTNFNEISIEIHTFSFKKMHLKLSSGKYQPSWPSASMC